jgi:hypothetical protein
MTIAYHQLGRQKDAQGMLALIIKGQGNKGAYTYAQVHANWGYRGRALHWLEEAVERKDNSLADIPCARSRASNGSSLS